MPVLTSPELDLVIKTAIDAGLATGMRRLSLTEGVLPKFLATIAEVPFPKDQLKLDVRRMNAVSTLPDGSSPLLTWLKNAADATYGTPAAKTFDAMYAKSAGRVPSSNPLIDEQPVNGGGEEVQISRRELLRFGFLQEGWEIGRSVGKMLVPIFKNGAPEMTASGEQAAGSGTGWMIAPSLIITNRHVIRARVKGQPEPDDFALQIAATTIQFDFDDPDAAGEIIGIQELLVSDVDLDYAVLRLKVNPGREPLPIYPAQVVHDPKSPAQVNVIQHPNGKHKQIGIRDNSIYKPTGSLLLYFTDTKEGSSGAPVFDDFWRVVALHRGFQPIENFLFQGNPTTVANRGTLIRSVLQSIKATHAGAWQEICSNRPALDAAIG